MFTFTRTLMEIRCYMETIFTYHECTLYSLYISLLIIKLFSIRIVEVSMSIHRSVSKSENLMEAIKVSIIHHPPTCK